MVTIGNEWLGLDAVERIVFRNEHITLHPDAMQRISDNFAFLERTTAGKVIYGINTGFGPMAQYGVAENELKQLQLNLIRSHAAGAGARLGDEYVKAAMVARLNSLLQGYSGVHPDAIRLLAEFINRGIIPCIFESGGVGASGDLVQLAHLALALIGEGDVSFQGRIMPAREALNANGLQPLAISIREGLALINGTSVMTGIGLVNLIRARDLLEWALTASAMIVEIVQGYDDFFSERLNAVKHHPGQIRIAAMMRTVLADSALTRKRSDHLFGSAPGNGIIKETVQHNYSIRCVPQILGPVADTIAMGETVLLNELNSVNDNPVIDMAYDDVLHGGNFHGDYVSLEMDKLRIAVTKLSMLMERQLNYLLNDRLNTILPPFVNLGTLGLNLGMQGAQFTATSSVAENQTLSSPISIHSIPCNNDNQDIVSMGTNAALLTRKVIDNSYTVVAIHFITIVQAIDHLQCSQSLSGYDREVYGHLRSIVPRFAEDTPKYGSIQMVREFMLHHRPGSLAVRASS